MTRLSYNAKSGIPSGLARSAIKILSNANRYSIMKKLLTAKRDLCVHELSEAIGISQSATSHQLSYLEARGVVLGVRMGKTMCYELTNSPIARKVAAVIHSLT